MYTYSANTLISTVECLHDADLEYILDVAVGANSSVYIVTYSLTHSLKFLYVCYARVPELHYLSTD